MDYLQDSVISLYVLFGLLPISSVTIDYFPHYPSYEHTNFFQGGFHGFCGHQLYNGFHDHHNAILPFHGYDNAFLGCFNEYDTPNGITLVGGVNRHAGYSDVNSFGQNRLVTLGSLAGLQQTGGLNVIGQMGGAQGGLDTIGRLGGLAALGRLGALAGLAGLSGMRINPLVVVHLGRRRKHGK